jgi:hypothetical protein
MATAEQQQQEEYTDDFPDNWIFDEHGDQVAGKFVRFERGQTKSYGAKPICVLEVDGIERSLWLNTTVLAGKFRDELRDRPTRELEPGERIIVKRLEKKTAADGKVEYWNFRVLFPDAPQPSTSDLFGLDDDGPQQPNQEESSVRGPSDDVPF